MSKYHLVTFGCQMNKSDSERVATILDNLGMEEATEPKDADFILLNSCSVRQSAEDRVFGQIRNFAKWRTKNPRLVLGVTGCMAGRDQDGAIQRKLSEVDLFFPTRDMIMLPQWLAEHGLIDSVEGDPRPAHQAERPTHDNGEYLKITPKYRSGRQAFVSIQTGCNNFCTYCVVPYARGREKNRPATDVMREINELAERGTIEITLLGQTVNSFVSADDRVAFSADNPYQNHFAALLWEINRIPGIERIHYTAPHPKSMNDEVIDALALPKHVRYLHLPIQSGSDEMLRKMNRKCTRSEMLDVFRRVKERVPDIALGTDIIVGFCGESRAMFEETLSFYRDVGFDISYNARYSPRTGTPAWRAFKDDVSHDEKRARWAELHRLMEDTTWHKNQVFVDAVAEVLVEDCVGDICTGYSRHMKLVRFKGEPNLIGQIVPVRIVTAHTWVLDGTLELEMDLAQACATREKSSKQRA
ncbi:MAG: tRNA (N6-isopentenyl adenosine(37)-C2)-methylthiotransferase MiaB [Patescibacteria group bacterium]